MDEPWTDGQMEGQNGRKDGWKDRMDGWTDERKEEWMDGRTDGGMDR